MVVYGYVFHLLLIRSFISDELYFQGMVCQILWAYCLILTISNGAYCVICYDNDNQSCPCLTGIDPQIQLTVTPEVEAMDEKRSTLKISSSSVLAEVDASL